MPEINVTRLVTENDLFEFSASRMERGNNAGAETWANAKAEAADNPILSDDVLPDFRDYVRGFGAWDREEIEAWDSIECNALFVQMVSGDMREAEALCPGDGPGGVDWEAYAALAEAGTASSRVYASGADVFYYVGD
jgi:hypothetical protein